MELQNKSFVWGLVKTSVCKCLVRATEKYETLIILNYYHWVDTSVGGLLVPEGIIHPVVSVSITGSIPLLGDN